MADKSTSAASAASSSADNEFECALSGKVADEVDLVVDDRHDEADLDALPVGWIRVTVERRGVNPAWLEIQKRKVRQLAGMQAQLPEGMPDVERAEALEDTKMAVDAAFYSIEVGTPKYVVVEDTAYVCNPDGNKQVAAEWKTIAEKLSIDVSGT